MRGFTLIELSIVLVIIGLIVGGVLVGQSLISAAAVRAQITQIEKFNTAVNTFRGKYGELPGDIEPSLVTQFGFTVVPTRAGGAGRGNGDGLINANVYPGTNAIGWGNSGENLFFWADLSANANLIEGTFNAVTDTTAPVISANAGFAPYLPQAKIGNGNYISVFTVSGVNYFQIINPAACLGNSQFTANRGMTVAQAYAIDKKMDDALPATGGVLAAMSVSVDNAGNANPGSWGVQGSFFPASVFSAAAASPTTCYDTTSGAYSITQNSGNGVNCALSFRFQ
jgi:prepilin-type N-terminal cleavage/methylation domain-containing protein